MKAILSSFTLLVAAAVVANGQDGPQHSLRATSQRRLTGNAAAIDAASSPSFAKRVMQSLFVFSALFDDTAAVTNPTGPPILTYQGAGTGAWGVQAHRTRSDSDMQEVEADTRDGTGPESPKGYSLVEDRPKCYFTLGSDYCPAAANNVWTNAYMSYLERTSQVLANAARMDPPAYQRIYNANNAGTFKCTTQALPPLRYSANAQQAAVKESQMLADPNCPFQHDTCSSYCGLYNGRCNWDARISKYEPNWQVCM